MTVLAAQEGGERSWAVAAATAASVPPSLRVWRDLSYPSAGAVPWECRCTELPPSAEEEPPTRSEHAQQSCQIVFPPANSQTQSTQEISTALENG